MVVYTFELDGRNILLDRGPHRGVEFTGKKKMQSVSKPGLNMSANLHAYTRLL